MTTIETIWTRISEIVQEYEAPDGAQYTRTADPFSFEYGPRSAGAVYYLDAPVIAEGTLYVGGGASSVATFGLWLSRDRGDDPQAVALSLANDAAALQRVIAAEPSDWQLLPGTSTVRVATDEQDTTVIAELRAAVDYEEVG